MSRVYTYIIKSTVYVSGFLYVLYSMYTLTFKQGDHRPLPKKGGLGGDDYIFAVFDSMF
jgi:hypothetical protein